MMNSQLFGMMLLSSSTDPWIYIPAAASPHLKAFAATKPLPHSTTLAKPLSLPVLPSSPLKR
jgi:hypothetical protein